MILHRSSGVLMPISSLWGTDSIGGFGKEALTFIDFLADAGFTWWQVLPFCMADECNSPYKSFSAFGGNPYFVDIRLLKEEGFLTAEEVASVREASPWACEYEKLRDTRLPLLRLAAGRADHAHREAVLHFITARPYLDQFCRFMAFRLANDNRPWYEWQDKKPMDETEYFAWAFIQYHFMKQWQVIHAYARSKGIKIMGDMPIYVAYDSCDVWANQKQFDLDASGRPRSVAGCPPDYFSAEGQLWGNPLYNWAYMKKDKYTWWADRMAHMLTLFDGVRIDHFRGMESYWAIPATAQSAKEGHWKNGPGLPLIKRLRQVAEDIQVQTGREVLIVAEDLGESTPALTKFVHDSGFPCMRVMQFAFDGNSANMHLPHRLSPNTVAYTGTHDNNTLLGYIWEADPETRRRTLRYCGFVQEDWNCPESYRAVIRTLFASVAGLTILPIQDILLYGADTRMNIPGQAEGNWRYRISREQLESVDLDFCREINQLYGRNACPPSKT